MNKSFLDLINACRKPNAELLEYALTKRSSFSRFERDFITYIAGFSHYEFAESLFQKFGFSFLKNKLMLFDSINEEHHVKVLINDQTLDFGSLHLETIAQAEQATILESRIQFRDQNGMYIDGLTKLLRDMSVAQAQDYLSRGNIGVYEDVVSIRREIDKNSFVLHFVRVSQRNILIDFKTLFSRVNTFIFVNFSDERPNLSLSNLKKNKEIYSLLKNAHWYVLDTEKSEEVIALIESIQANYALVPYAGDDYDYFRDILLDVTARISSAATTL